MRLVFAFVVLAILSFSGICQADPNSIEQLRQKAESGDPNSQLALAKEYFDGRRGIPRDYSEAVKWFRRAAEQGLADAQNNLGRMYYNGHGVPQNYNEAVKWFTKAATQGYAKAQCNLGLMYSTGRGVSQNYRTAAKWYTKAAAQGVSDAQVMLGVIYCKGEGVPQNYSVAANWFRKAAAQGVIEAQLFLGIMYQEGDGVSKDYVESYKWFLLAEMNGDRDAKKFKESLRKEMTASQIAQAQQRTDRFKRIKGFIAEEKKKSEEDEQITGDIKRKSSATGFLITSDGFILTACHAVEEATKIQVLYNQKQYAAKVIRKDTLSDVAVLKIEDNNLPFLPIVSSSAVKLGDAVFTIGYPRITLQGSDPKYTEGSISSLSGLDNDSKCFQISVPVQPGNSGGPLVNKNGEVIGIIVSTLNDVAILLITGSLPQNVNYALKSSYVLSFIESIPDLSQKLTAPNYVKDRAATIERTEKSIVVIIGYE